VVINPASGLQVFIAGIWETLQHGFWPLGRVDGDVRVNLWRHALTVVATVDLLILGVRAALPLLGIVSRFILPLFAPCDLHFVAAELTPKLVDLGTGGFFAGSACRIIALAVQVLLSLVALVIVVAATAVSLLVAATAIPVPVTTASTPTAEPVLIPAIVIELVLVAIITLIESCLEARVKRAIITIAHARSAWMIVIILADIP
jgi:hypothetical protein